MVFMDLKIKILIDYPNAWHHVMNRARRRGGIAVRLRIWVDGT